MARGMRRTCVVAGASVSGAIQACGVQGGTTHHAPILVDREARRRVGARSESSGPLVLLRRGRCDAKRAKAAVVVLRHGRPSLRTTRKQCDDRPCVLARLVRAKGQPLEISDPPRRMFRPVRVYPQ